MSNAHYAKNDMLTEGNVCNKIFISLAGTTSEHNVWV